METRQAHRGAGVFQVVPHRPIGAIQGSRDVNGGRGQGGTGVGEDQDATPPLGQRHRDDVLQGTELLGHRRRADVQGAGDRGQASAFAEFAQHPQAVRIHQFCFTPT